MGNPFILIVCVAYLPFLPVFLLATTLQGCGIVPVLVHTGAVRQNSLNTGWGRKTEFFERDCVRQGAVSGRAHSRCVRHMETLYTRFNEDAAACLDYMAAQSPWNHIDEMGNTPPIPHISNQPLESVSIYGKVYSVNKLLYRPCMRAKGWRNHQDFWKNRGPLPTKTPGMKKKRNGDGAPPSLFQ